MGFSVFGQSYLPSTLCEDSIVHYVTAAITHFTSMLVGYYARPAYPPPLFIAPLAVTFPAARGSHKQTINVYSYSSTALPPSMITIYQNYMVIDKGLLYFHRVNTDIHIANKTSCVIYPGR